MEEHKTRSKNISHQKNSIDSGLDILIHLRHKLHRNAELSHNEVKTSGILKSFIHGLEPDKIIDFDNGFAVVWDSGKPGETILFRADIDALPITEIPGLEYVSQNQGVMHACGHDGHSTILAGLAEAIAQSPPDKGKVVLLFQPAEETGEGAERVVNNPDFVKIEPDFVFGLHNIPGYPKHSILLKDYSFACASRGMTIKLFGKTSHAAEPENGINPVFAIKNLIEEFYALVSDKKKFSSFTNLTIIHIRLGEVAFGTSPGYAEVMATLRSETNEDMQMLVEECEKILKKTTYKEKLKHEVSYSEVFPATINNPEAVGFIEQSTTDLNLETVKLEKAFRWSEDFSQYTNRYKGAFFGLGAGTDHPKLHNPDYDFPDEIVYTGVKIFFNIYMNILKK